MRVTVNEEFIRKRAKYTRWASFVGLGVLALGFAISLNEAYFFWSLPALAIGLVLASFSGFNANRYVKEPRPDQVLAKSLRGFDKNYHLFNYTSPIPHVLLTPSRVYAVLIKLQDGVVRREGNRWRRNFTIRRFIFLFGEEGLGNPTRDAHNQAESLYRDLAEEFGEEAPPVEPIVVFTNPNVQLELGQSSVDETDDVPAMMGSNLKKYIRSQPKGTALDSDLRKRLAAFLSGAESSQGDDE